MKQSKGNDIIIQEKSGYREIFQKRPTRYRIYETIVFAVVTVVTSILYPSGFAPFIEAVIIIGAAPWFYRAFFEPEYVLSKTQLTIRKKGKEWTYPLTDIERVSAWKATYRLQGKKDALMVTNKFLNLLDEQVAKMQKKRRR